MSFVLFPGFVPDPLVMDQATVPGTGAPRGFPGSAAAGLVRRASAVVLFDPVTFLWTFNPGWFYVDGVLLWGPGAPGQAFTYSTAIGGVGNAFYGQLGGPNAGFAVPPPNIYVPFHMVVQVTNQTVDFDPFLFTGPVGSSLTFQDFTVTPVAR